VKEKIDHTNYEAWLLDRLEGNLSPEQEAELDLFLALHPELAPDGGALPSLMPDELSLPDRNALKRSIPPEGLVDATSLEDHLIAKLEGDLSHEQLLALEKFLYEHPEYAGVSRLYALTKLVPDAMTFAGRDKLERHLPPHGLPDAARLEDLLVARLEGDLTAEQERALDVFIGNDVAAQRTWALIQRTKVEAGSRTYPHKDKLKKGGRVIAISFNRVYVRLAAAASIAILFSAGLWYMSRPVDPQGAHFAQLRAPDKEQPAVTEPTSQEGEPQEPKATPVEQKEVEDADPASAKQAGDVASPAPPATYSPGKKVVVPAAQVTPEREAYQLAAARTIIPTVAEPVRELRSVEVAEVPVVFAEPSASDGEQQALTLGTLLAGTVREKVLDQPVPESRPIDMSDAFAVVDKGLKVVGGNRSGLTVDRSEGRVRSFGLRIGSLAVSTGTGL
jgi:anti-sigma factor RsiW